MVLWQYELAGEQGQIVYKKAQIEYFMVIKHVNKSVEDPHLKNLYPTKEEMTDPDPIFENKSEFRSITLVDIKVKYLLRILYFFSLSVFLF